MSPEMELGPLQVPQAWASSGSPSCPAQLGLGTPRLLWAPWLCTSRDPEWGLMQKGWLEAGALAGRGLGLTEDRVLFVELWRPYSLSVSRWPPVVAGSSWVRRVI